MSSEKAAPDLLSCSKILIDLHFSHQAHFYFTHMSTPTHNFDSHNHSLLCLPFPVNSDRYHLHHHLLRSLLRLDLSFILTGPEIKHRFHYSLWILFNGVNKTDCN